jgi:hypothetical protein
MERKGDVQTVHVYVVLLYTHVSMERKGHVQPVHVYLGIIIHTCQRGKERSRSDCARILRDYYSHVLAWKGRVTFSLCTYI